MAADTRHWDVGAYVLGVLDPADLESFEIHLATCDSCAEEVASLLPVVALLPVADAESLLAPRPEPRSFGPTRAPLESVRGKPRHGRQHATPRPYGRLAVAAGITAAVLAGGSFVAGTQFSTTGAPLARASTGSTADFTASAPTRTPAPRPGSPSRPPPGAARSSCRSAAYVVRCDANWLPSVPTRAPQWSLRGWSVTVGTALRSNRTRCGSRRPRRSRSRPPAASRSGPPAPTATSPRWCPSPPDRSRRRASSGSTVGNKEI
jgi:Putative zinc-finger